MRIDLGRRDVGMTKHLLHDAKIGAPFDKMCCKRVPECVRRKLFVDLGGMGILANEIPDRHSRKCRASLLIEKNGIGAAARTKKQWTNTCEILVHCIASNPSNGYNTFLASFAKELDQSFFQE